jgi:anthranilate phosphoribosyltransferase
MTPFEEIGGWPRLIGDLLARTHLTYHQAQAAMATILAGEATPAQLIGFVVALRAKGETGDELTGMLDAVLAAATRVTLPDDVLDKAVDIVGTGGDRSHSINVSTLSALVVAAAGVPVCKHGARAASSQCGTADLLEALGADVELGPQGVARCVTEVGFGFCLAARFHPAFRFAAASRREIGVPTAFNLLGPMANPARVRRHVIGVADPGFADRMIESLAYHGSELAWVVSGPGLDELSTTGPSTVHELRHGDVRTFTVDGVDLGLARAQPEDLVGGAPAENATLSRRVLAGDHGAHRDIVLLNAAAGLVVGGRVADLPGGIDLAAATIDSGAAVDLLERFVAMSRSGPTEGS